MKIRLAAAEDLPKITALYNAAKELLLNRGIDQWQDGYPNAASAASDICTGGSYVLEDNGEVIGTAFIGFGTEPTYEKIYEGSWKQVCERYAFLHRVAVSTTYSGRGLAGQFFKEAEGLCRKKDVTVLRCDTHRQNLAMQKTLERCGFTYCGIIYLEDGAERFAYEKTVNSF